MQVYDTTGLSPGETLVVAQQVDTAVSSTGRYLYQLDITEDFGTPLTQSLYGSYLVVAEDAESLWPPAGRCLGSIALVSVSQQQQATPAGTLTYSAGSCVLLATRAMPFMARTGAGGYTSPDWDNGTLAGDSSNGWIYSRPDGTTVDFDGSGYQSKTTSADGFAVVSVSYSSGKVSLIETPDGGLSTLTYDGSSGRSRPSRRATAPSP